MKITNKFGISHAWVHAAQTMLEQYDAVGWRSVTSLIGPPQISELRRRHDHEMEQDVSDMIWLVLGSAVHTILEMASDKEKNVVTEQRMIVPILGKQISFKADRIEQLPTTPTTWEIVDYKITKVFSWKKGPNFDYEAQNNLYRYLYGKVGFVCTKGSLELLLKDWSLMELKKEGREYPPREVMRVPLDAWPDKEVEAYLHRRIEAHSAAEQLADEDLPECTEDERWAKPTTFAIKKIKDGKMADKAVPGTAGIRTRSEAESWIDSAKADGKDKGCSYVIEERKGESLRCERYCPCRPFCRQYPRIACDIDQKHIASGGSQPKIADVKDPFADLGEFE